MARRAFILTLEWIAGLLAGVVLLAGFAVWQLSQGSVSIDFLTQEIENAINSDEMPIAIDIGNTALTWGGWSKALEVVAQDVDITGANGQKVASLSEIAIDLYVPGLLRGVVAPTKIEILKPNLYLRRKVDGNIDVILPKTSADQVNNYEVLNGSDFSAANSDHDFDVNAKISTSLSEALAFLKEMENMQGNYFALQYLKSISVYDADAVFDDFITYKRWRGDDIIITFVKTAEQSILDVSGNISSGDKNADIGLSLFHPLHKAELGFEAEIIQTNGEFISHLLPELDPYLAYMPEMSGKVTGVYDIDNSKLTSRGKMHVEAGNIETIADIDLESGNVTGELIVNSADVRKIVSFGDALKEFKQLDSAIDASLNVSANFIDKVIQSIDGKIIAASGDVNLPDVYENVLSFKDLEASINIDQNFQHIEIPKLSFKTDEFQMNATATALRNGQGENTPYNLELEAIGTDFNMRYLDQYWPRSLGVDARNWVIPNIPEGDVPSASVKISGIYDLETKAFELQDVGGEIQLKDATVDYLSPMPIASKGVATARYGIDWFDISVHSGEVGEIKLRDGKVVFTELGTKDNAYIKLPITTPAKDGMVFLDHEPLGFISELGLETDDITGTAQGVVELNFELLKDLKKEDIKVDVEADLSDLTIMDIVPDAVLTAEKMKLLVTEKELHAYGEIQDSDYKFNVDYFEYFRESNILQRKYVLSGQADDKFLIKEGLTVYPYLEGAFDLSVVIQENFDGQKSFIGNVDFANSALLFPFYNWYKPYTVPATVDFNLSQQGDGDVIVEDLNFTSDDLEMELTATFSPDMQIAKKVDIQRFVSPDTDIQLNLEQTKDNHLNVKITGDKFDATGAFDEILNSNTLSTDTENPSATIEVFLDQLTMEPKRKFEKVRMVIQHTGEELDQVSLDAQLSNGQEIQFNYGPDVKANVEAETDGRNFILSTSSIGQFLNDMNLYQKVEGGNALIVGHKAYGSDHIDGKLFVDSYVIHDAPALARVLEAVSLTGLPSAISGSEMVMDKAEGDFRLVDGIFRIKNIRTYNRSVGLVIDGQYDLDNDEIRIKGTVVPAYGVNQAIGNIPVLGWILTGGDGGGLFGATFYIAGGKNNPNVNVNPISVITPGILRRLFDFSETNYSPLSQEEIDRKQELLHDNKK
ncbi:AsmA-like C-terminal domain-containing protein [Curvivirga sp.]|uniref:YhdP family protein n=1 Tax=Curvivirga sp. TaxID=2856848 RepID=UPI003B5C188E